MSVQAYCFKEKKRITVVNPVYALNSRGRPMCRGTCPSCGGKVMTMISNADGAKHGLKIAPKKGSGSRRRSAPRPARKSARKSARRSNKRK